MFVEKECLQCLMKFNIRSYLSTKGFGIFCSKSCRAIFNNAKRKIIDPYTRFVEKIEITKNCWLWEGYKNNCGYGEFKVNNKMTKAHRFSWSYYYGEIPAGLYVLHSCDNPGCVNPEHLFLGTPKDNAIDRQKKDRGYRPRGEKCAHAKLKNEDVIKIRNRINNNETVMKIAKDYNVSWTTINSIKKQKTWNHIK